MRISDWSSDVCSSDLFTTTLRSLRIASRTEMCTSRCRCASWAQPSLRRKRGRSQTRCSRRALNCHPTRSSACGPTRTAAGWNRSEEHTSELQSLMRISYAVFCLKKKIKTSMRQLSDYPAHRHQNEGRHKQKETTTEQN